MNAIFRYNSTVNNIQILDSTNDSADCNSKNEMMQENRQRYIFLLNLWKMDGLETWTNFIQNVLWWYLRSREYCDTKTCTND